MVWQIITVLYLMVRAAAVEPWARWIAPLMEPERLGHPWVANSIIYFTTFLTLISGFSYFWKNRRLFADA